LFVRLYANHLPWYIAVNVVFSKSRDKCSKMDVKDVVVTLSKKGERNTCSFRSPLVTLPLNLFFPTHSVLFPSALLWSPINIIDCIKFYVNCSALTGMYDWQYKYLFVCLYANHHLPWYIAIFYQKPLYKLLHQSFFYSFITLLPSESGATLHYSTILP
jgi:hypothetical protein